MDARHSSFLIVNITTNILFSNQGVATQRSVAHDHHFTSVHKILILISL